MNQSKIASLAMMAAVFGSNIYNTVRSPRMGNKPKYPVSGVRVLTLGVFAKKKKGKVNLWEYKQLGNGEIRRVLA